MRTDYISIANDYEIGASTILMILYMFYLSEGPSSYISQNRDERVGWSYPMEESTQVIERGLRRFMFPSLCRGVSNQRTVKYKEQKT